MAQLNVRLPDDFYRAVLDVLEKKLKTDISSFIRNILLDTLLIYGEPERNQTALAAIGRKHEAVGIPTLAIDMITDWFSDEKSGDSPDFKRFKYYILGKSEGGKSGRMSNTDLKPIPSKGAHSK